MDNEKNILEENKIGEILIVGNSVAEGYLEVPEKNPFITYKGQKAYLTGDLGFFDKEGDIHFIGRSDFQIKLNGFRVELEEINQVLSSYRAHLAYGHTYNLQKKILGDFF